jgi:uncharacterized protein
MDTLIKISNAVKAVLECSRTSHSWDHTMRVYNLCMHIGRKEKADLAILKYAALLHDIGRKYQDNSGGRICHAEKGAELAAVLLKKHGMDRETTQRIIHCIKTHRFRGKEKPESIEAKVLFDADKLDSIGAVGIGRAFLFAGEVGARLHNGGIDISKTMPYTREDTAFREYEVKLKKVRERIITEEGKRLAAQRHKFMAVFFKRISMEVNGNL